MTNSLTTLTGLLGLSFASGVNLYAAVLVAGLGIRYGFLQGLPHELDALASPIVLSIAAVMYVIEFFADKIPFVSAIWDTVHTFVRPVGAAAVAITAVGHTGTLEQTLAGLLGGSVALASHATKMGTRLLMHSTGEPFTQAGVSLAEDAFAITLVLLVAKYPYVALAVVIALLVMVAFLLPLIWRALRAVYRATFGRLFAWFNPPPERQGV